MICLDNTDTLEGGASVDAVVDYTVHGLVGTTFTQLAAGQLSNVDPSVLYTAAAAISIVSITLVNTHTSAVTVNLYLDPGNGGSPRRLIPKTLSLGIGYALVYDGQRFHVMDASGCVQHSFAVHAPTHQSGGTDPIKLDDLATPDDNTDLDVSTSVHGLCPKAPNDVTMQLLGLGAWSSQMVKCSIRKSATQNVNSAVYTKVILDSEVYDVGACFDSAVNYRFTAPTAGYYLVTALCGWYDNMAAGVTVQIHVYKNGASIYGLYTPTDAISPGGCIAGVLLLAANDYLEMYVYQESGLVKRVYYSNFVYLCVHRISQ